MGIKFAVLRTHDGHAYDLLKPGATIKAGMGGFFDVLFNGIADKVRVSIDGVVCEGHPPKLPTDRPAGKHPVLIEQVHGDTVVHSERGEIEVIAEPQPVTSPVVPPPAPPADPEPKPEAEVAASE